jgi:hypothetical protein
MAAAIATALLDRLEPPGERVTTEAAVRRAWDAVERLTSIAS